ncbi:hypothetical protein BDW_04115 [Bdellovibrio bacteriovorus W]|nr:hypothetical protein BDW_04115 [Bdellovibrio bacteriovorus W]
MLLLFKKVRVIQRQRLFAGIKNAPEEGALKK